MATNINEPIDNQSFTDLFGISIPSKKAVVIEPLQVFAPKVSLNRSPQVVQRISLNTKSFTLFNDFSEFCGKRRLMALAAKPSVVRTPSSGVMSKQSSTAMKRALNNLFLISKQKTMYNDQYGTYSTFKNNFITLTLSGVQFHTDSFIKRKLFKNFIDYVRKDLPSLSYVWKAETQKNGNLHFHIITDHYLACDYVNMVWNRIQRNHGYIQAYNKKYGHWMPPSTNVQKLKERDRSAAYMVKYFAKEYGNTSPLEIRASIDALHLSSIDIDSNSKLRDNVNSIEKLLIALDAKTRRKVEGKLWGCSDNLLLKPFNTILAELPVVDQEHLMSSKSLGPKEFYETYVFDSFNNLLAGLTASVRSAIRFYFRLLVRPIKIPDIIYRLGTRYKYA